MAHSWWIPELGGKFDAIRGLTNETWFKATGTGTFKGQCAEYCGSNHAFMTAKVQPHEVQGYKDLGAIAVIAKPFDPVTLPDEVRALWVRQGEVR